MNSRRQRIRANSSSSNHDLFSTTTKKLRVEVTKLEVNTDLSSEQDSDSDTQDRSQPRVKKQRSLRSNCNLMSPNTKKRRSELQKLLEAGLSSFHCETAKQAADRLGPLKVDVSEDADNNSESGSSSVTNNKGLLQEADVNQNPKKRKAKIKNSRNSRNSKASKKKNANNEDSEDDDDEDNEHLDHALKDIDGKEVEVDGLEYSFERTPMRESWFCTYTRQDQGDEILYYPQYQSFPLPYEMPMSTFCPKAIKPKSKGASGRATPDNEESIDQPQISVRSTRTKKNLTHLISDQTVQASFFDKISSKKAAALKAASEFSRKSPRGHASTKSLLCSEPFGDAEDLEDPEFKDLSYLDECSNDSSMSLKQESEDKLIEIANGLDSFFTQSDPLLLCHEPTSSSTHDHRKRSRRSSSSSVSKSHSKKSASKTLDKVIDANVDPMFLDCLEDELPR